MLIRKFLSTLTGALLCATASTAFAQADNYPSKPIHIVVGFGPGVGMEVSTRLVGELLSKEIGQPLVIENKAGASTMIAAQYVANAPKDGYTVLMWNNQSPRSSRPTCPLGA